MERDHTVQPDLFGRTPKRDAFRFDGETFDPALDAARLTGQLLDVYNFMRDGKWHTLPELAAAIHGSQTSMSARLRDLRKARFGSHTVERERVSGGLWQYRMVPRAHGR